VKITYGICVGPGQYPIDTINSIQSEANSYQKDYEILLIGENIPSINKNVRVIDFDESAKPGWITRKKNLIAQEARYPTLCLMHDYFMIKKSWINGLLMAVEKHPNWSVMCNRINNLEGTRHADWMINPRKMEELIATNPERFIPLLMGEAPHENHPKFFNALPYNVSDLHHIQYVSGGFILVKTSALLNVPINEDMVWGTPPGEDVEWSERLIANDHKIVYNEHSVTDIGKPGKWQVKQMPIEFVEELRKYYGSNPL